MFSSDSCNSKGIGLTLTVNNGDLIGICKNVIHSSQYLNLVELFPIRPKLRIENIQRVFSMQRVEVICTIL